MVTGLSSDVVDGVVMVSGLTSDVVGEVVMVVSVLTFVMVDDVVLAVFGLTSDMIGIFEDCVLTEGDCLFILVARNKHIYIRVLPDGFFLKSVVIRADTLYLELCQYQ